MPSHIYVKTGNWEKAIEQNVDAMEADWRYRDRATSRSSSTAT